MMTIAIANQKGGCGKTTSAINLGAALAGKGRKILIIDLDPQSHASYGLGVSNQIGDRSVYNALTDIEGKRRAIRDCVLNAAPNLDIVASNILLSTLEQELKDKEDAVSRLYLALTSEALNYDYVVIDCPPSLGFLTFNALRAADLVIVPLDMSAFSLMGVGKLLGMLELIKLKINHSPRVSAIATLFDKRTKYSQIMLDEIKAFFKDEMCKTVIRVSVALKKAAAKGISVIQFDRNSNGALDYLSLADEIIAIERPVQRELPAAVEPATVSQEIQNAAPVLDSILKDMIFSIEAPSAKDIYLVGDFNHWKIGEENRLLRDNSGRWEKKVPLAPGRYRYKFVVDGEWKLDTENTEKEENPFGTFDSIIKL